MCYCFVILVINVKSVDISEIEKVKMIKRDITLMSVDCVFVAVLSQSLTLISAALASERVSL